jgi:signal transduction histidine kinase
MEAGEGVDALLRAMTQNAIEITGAQRASVVLLEQGDQLRIRVATTASAKDTHLDIKDLSHTVIRRVIVSKQPLLLHDVFDDSELLGRPSITSMALRTILCVPMMRRGILYGVMYADHTSALSAFDNVDLEVLSLFSTQAAGALEASRLVEDLQRSYEDLKAAQERLVRGERLRVIGEISSGVAHEFNNLLTSILARVQMMGLTYLSPGVRRDLDLIEKAALDAAEVVRRLQSFSRRQRSADFVLLNLEQMCADAVDFLKPLWRTRRRQGLSPLHVQLQTEPNLVMRGDPTELREVVVNLIKNAIDASPGGGKITVTASRRQGQLRLRVEDSGVGIPAEHRSRVFDPFFTTKGDRGTGLGLSITQQIVHRHGGTIELDSEEGVGTQITITLPAAVEAAQTGTPALPGGTTARPLKVVVVDDDVEVLRPLCAYLQSSGYEVVSAQGGVEGLEAIQAARPDVVLSDIAMPGVSGIELCRRVQSMELGIPIVLMSGWASEVDPLQVRDAGAQALLAKPFSMQQVTELLSSVTRE